MAIHTHEAVSGFIATDPQLTRTSTGRARFYARFGQEHFRKEEDGSFTKLETSFHNLVIFGRTAEHAAERFSRGDSFVASGAVEVSQYEKDGGMVEAEAFVASRIGHDAARTRYAVDRSPVQPAQAESAAFDAPPQRRSSEPASVGF